MLPNENRSFQSDGHRLRRQLGLSGKSEMVSMSIEANVVQKESEIFFLILFTDGHEHWLNMLV